MNLFLSLRDYEEFIYTIQYRYWSINSSTLVVFRRGADMTIVHGEVLFHRGIRLLVWERLTLEDGPLRIETYGYEVWHEGQQLYWYDSQPHPNNPNLAATHPHHKHVPPDIKHNRILAPGLSFTQPNLPLLIAEIEQLIK